MGLRKLFVVLFFLSVAVPGVCQQQHVGTSTPMLVTHTTFLQKKSGKWEKRLRNQRLQLHYSPESKQLALKAHPLLKIKNLAFSFSLQTGSTQEMVRRKEIAYHLLKAHGQLPVTTKMGLDSAGQEKYASDLKSFVEGGRARKWIYGQWLTVATWDNIADISGVSILVKRPLRKIATLTIDSLPTIALPSLPTLSEAVCTPIDRFYELRKLKGYGIDNIKYQPYTGHDKDIFRRSHEVYFSRNKYQPEQQSVASLRQYLNDNDLSILKADFFGYSSMEGDSLLNRRLQEKRASYLYETLQQMSEDPIEADSIGFGDGYENLVLLAKKNNIKWLPALTRQQLRDTLSADSALRESLEPLLSESRKAELKLVLARRLNREERITKAYRVLNQTAFRVITPRGQIITLEQQRLSGILSYLFRLYINGDISKIDLLYAVDTAPNTAFVRLLFTYMMEQQLELERPPQLDSALWTSRLNAFDWNNIFLSANAEVVLLITSGSIDASMKPMLHGMAVDIQYYTFRHILSGLLQPSILCYISYPRSSGFYGLILNRYAFIHKVTTEKGMSMSCYSSGRPDMREREGPTFTEAYVDALADSLRQRAREFQPLFENAEFSPPSFYNGPQSDYYHFLKILFVDNDESVRQLVSQSDQLIEFDLFRFVSYQINTLDPLANYWLDEDIPIEKISSLLRKLLREPGRLCPVMLENTTLSFYLKTLYFLQRYYDPANPYQIGLSRDALAYISNYYRRRGSTVTPALEAVIQEQLNLFYWQPGAKDVSQYRLY